MKGLREISLAMARANRNEIVLDEVYEKFGIDKAQVAAFARGLGKDTISELPYSPEEVYATLFLGAFDLAMLVIDGPEVPEPSPQTNAYLGG